MSVESGQSRRFNPHSPTWGNSDSWQRSDPREGLIERQNAVTWLVTLPGGNVHETQLYRDNGDLRCNCDCPAHRYRGQCSHTAALWKAARCDRTGIGGEPVEIADLTDLVTRGYNDEL